MGIRRYGTSDDAKVSLESAEAREIVGKIMDIQPTQRMLMYVLHDLAMNIEHDDHMRRLVTLIKELSEDDPSNISPLSI